METALAQRSGPAGRLASRLVLALALALAACGGGGDAPESGDTPADTAAALQTTLATDTCTGPPPAFGQAVFQGTWQGLLDSLAAHAVTFPDIPGNDDTASVRLCATCEPVRLEIRSSNLTPCLQPDSLRGESRILGLFILVDSFPGSAQWDPIPAGDTIFTFAFNPGDSPARLAYRQGNNINTALSAAWRFLYCQDGHHNPKIPRAQWRDRVTAAMQTDAEEEEEEETGKYGWMACASGCCQFYTTPPGDGLVTTPDVANPNAPDTVGSVRRRVPWCPTGP
ncbi:MAG TPA: hypothetical protein VFR37_07635 [Longimicrobium sp.]|nr:hypothetical protein [Longimicrobium sp.]